MRLHPFAPSGRAVLLRAAAVAVLSIGYADLLRGGITAAPILMLVGYLILVPAVILTWR